MTDPAQSHRPADHTTVMLQEVLDILKPRDGSIYVDGTFGNGGASKALLDAAACQVWAIDRDPEAVRRGEVLADTYHGRLTVVQGRFGDMDKLVETGGPGSVDGVTLDLGVSSMQLDQAERGFSFRADGPLDMRMAQDQEPDGRSAADLVNELSEAELARLLRDYGEERKARQVARAICRARRETPITRTSELADIVHKVVKRTGDGIDPATRTFQALRIAVNDELGELDRGLAAAERLLTPGGCLAVIAFHSLEDRAVKRFLTLRSGKQPRGSRHQPEAIESNAPAATFELLIKGAQQPSAEECRRNPRARSARLRAARRTAQAPWSQDGNGGTS